VGVVVNNKMDQNKSKKKACATSFVGGIMNNRCYVIVYLAPGFYYSTNETVHHYVRRPTLTAVA